MNMQKIIGQLLDLLMDEMCCMHFNFLRLRGCAIFYWQRESQQ